MNSRFDDWDDLVDCNKCQRYYDDTCDGTKVGYKKKCNSYVATRSSDLPARIGKLEKRVRDNEILWSILTISLLLLEFWRFFS